MQTQRLTPFLAYSVQAQLVLLGKHQVYVEMGKLLINVLHVAIPLQMVKFLWAQIACVPGNVLMDM